MNNMTSNKTWHDMSQEEWVLVLRVLNKYMSSMKMVGTCTKYMQEHGRVPTQKQADTLQHFWNRSQGKKQYEKDMETDEYTRAMNQKFKSNTPVEVDTSAYHDFLIEERPTIGFKTQVKNMSIPAPNRYKMDVSPEARAKRFDELFSDI